MLSGVGEMMGWEELVGEQREIERDDGFLKFYFLRTPFLVVLEMW